MYVYIETKKEIYTVGFFSPDGTWHPDSDFGSKLEARTLIHYLNGGNTGRATEYVKEVQ